MFYTCHNKHSRSLEIFKMSFYPLSFGRENTAPCQQQGPKLGESVRTGEFVNGKP